MQEQLKHTKCPRCLSPWSKDRYFEQYKCLTNCGMHYTEMSNGSQILFLENIIEEGDVLVWQVSKPGCVYGKSFHVGSNLPVLPFDIEVDKLKLYLTFS